MNITATKQELLEFPEITPATFIPGLTYIPNYIDQQQEAELTRIIDAQPWITELKRRVQHYGYRYDYKARSIANAERLGMLPDWLEPYGLMMYNIGMLSARPDQVIINEYQPGQGIAPHIDCVPCFGRAIASISLCSSCIMDFTHSKTGEKTSLLLEPRSLLLLTDDARYLWKHGIAHRKMDRHQGQSIKRGRRISLTFRKVMPAV